MLEGKTTTSYFLLFSSYLLLRVLYLFTLNQYAAFLFLLFKAAGVNKLFGSGHFTWIY